jgi:bifunctional non-homologous end joining protein LigD
MPKRPSGVPRFRPQLALLVKTAPEGEEWLHELKLDGYRIGLAIEDGRVTLLSRRENEWTADFPELVSAARRLHAKSALLDGELAAVLPDGRTSMHLHAGAQTAYFAFDLLHLDGEDLTALPLEERKKRLRQVLGARPAAPFRYVEHVVGGGAKFFQEACRRKLEGIVSKLRTSPYKSAARNATWQKTKCVLRQEFVIGGYIDSVIGGLGAMLLGTYDDDGNLLYAGKVGTGHQSQAGELLAAFRRIVRSSTPFAATTLPKSWMIRGVHWLEPRLVAEVAFMEWTGHDHIRHPSFQAMRPDKKPSEVKREIPVEPDEGHRGG